MIFHSVAKSMLFQAVGSIENALGTRDIEAMHGLLLRLPRLTYVMGIGIAGMYLAPFGMLISKWVALRSFVDSNNYLLVIFLAYGSGTTMFYWTKWLSKLVSLHHTREPVTDRTHRDQYLSMFVHAAATLGLCLLFPLVSDRGGGPHRAHAAGFRPCGALHECAHHHGHHGGVGAVRAHADVRAHPLHPPGLCAPFTWAAPTRGDNTYFVNSYGEPEHLYLSNWYMRFEFGMRRLMRPAVIVSAGGAGRDAGA